MQNNLEGSLVAATTWLCTYGGTCYYYCCYFFNPRYI